MNWAITPTPRLFLLGGEGRLGAMWEEAQRAKQSSLLLHLWSLGCLWGEGPLEIFSRLCQARNTLRVPPSTPRARAQYAAQTRVYRRLSVQQTTGKYLLRSSVTMNKKETSASAPETVAGEKPPQTAVLSRLNCPKEAVLPSSLQTPVLQCLRCRGILFLS